jgi:hypothetical protein
MYVFHTHRCRRIKKKRRRGTQSLTLLPTCDVRISAHIGSPFYGAKIGERKALLLAWCWVRKLTIEAAASFADAHPNTVRTWFDKFRDAAAGIVDTLASDIWGGGAQMGGPGKTVQVRSS